MATSKDVIKERGKVIVVTGAKGGVGKSIFASNLSVALSSAGGKVAILDNMFQFSDLSILFDKNYKYNLNDVLNSFSEVDVETIGLYLMKFNKKNLYVLPGSNTPEEGECVEEEKFIKIVNLLAQKMDYVIIDAHNGFTGTNIELFDLAHKIFLVSNSEIHSVINTQKHINVMGKMNLHSKVEIVINKFKKRNNLNKKQINEMLDDYTIHYLPRADRLIERSINIGIPTSIVNTISRFSKKIFSIAKDVIKTNKEGEE